MMMLAFVLAAAAAPPLADDTTQPLKDAVTAAIRNCPQSKGDEIAVCAKDRGFSEKYRIEKLNKPEANLEPPAISLSGVSKTGSALPGDCTSASAAGTIGCSKRDYDDWAAWKKKQKEAGDKAFPW